MDIQRTYKFKYQPFNRGGNIKRKRMYKTVDSIDIQVEILTVPFEELSSSRRSEPSEAIRKRVVAARRIQLDRFAGETSIYCNAQMNSRQLNAYARPTAEGFEVLRKAMDRYQMSARAYDRILKVARTIADLDQSPDIKPQHIHEAISYRNLDRSTWGTINQSRPF